MRVFLVDDHPLFRQALAATVANIRAGLEVDQFDTVQGLRDALAKAGEVALILLDLKLPDNTGMSGLLSIKVDRPNVPVALISAHDDWDTVQTAITCGAAGFVSKAAGLAELSAAIEALIDGESWFPDNLAEPSSSLGLSRTQMRVLEGIQRGLMNKQIAFELSLSEHTVKYHLSGIFKKLNCRNRAELLRSLDAKRALGTPL